jgi:hypothetical protein
MTKEQFKARWESDDAGGGITLNEIAECAKAWGIFESPRTLPTDRVIYRVLQAAGTSDAEDFAPSAYDTGSGTAWERP